VSCFLLKLRDLLIFSVKKTKLNMGSIFAFDTYVEITYFSRVKRNLISYILKSAGYKQIKLSE